MRGMGRVLLLIASCMTLLACVTETTFVDSKKRVRSIEFNKEDAAKTRLVLGLSYLDAGQYEQAKFNLEKALVFGPDRADVNYSLGYYYQMVGEMEQAEDYYLKAIDLEPNNPDTLNNYGTFLCNINQIDKAEKYFKKAIDISKYTRAAESYENMAICALGSDQMTKAENYFEMSFKHNPSRGNNVLSLSGIKYASGDLVAALDFYSRYLRLNQSSARGLLLGYILETRRGRITQANKYAERLKNDFANSREALYFTMGEVDNSEFEQLRKKYKALSRDDSKPAPKIRITRKNGKSETPPANPSRAKPALIGSGALANAGNDLVSSLAVAKELQQKVKMFSAPLSDTESIEIPAKTQKTIAISRMEPLPEEKVLTHQVVSKTVVNDRAETDKNRNYLELDNSELTIPSYRVVAGDNLYRVSVKFNVQIANLMIWNELKKEELVSGQTLFVADPKPMIRVDKEMRLSTLAKQYKIEPTAIMKWHGVDADGWLKKGTQVYLVDPLVYRQLGELANQEAQEQEKNEKEIAETSGEFLAIPEINITLPTHKVKNSEFLYAISRKYNIKINALIRWNGLESESDIKAGQTLYLADPDIYHQVSQVQKLSDVANHLQIELSQLMAWNNVETDGLVKAGTKLLKVNAERYQ